jgi:hypothetical protein
MVAAGFLAQQCRCKRTDPPGLSRACYTKVELCIVPTHCSVEFCFACQECNTGTGLGHIPACECGNTITGFCVAIQFFSGLQSCMPLAGATGSHAVTTHCVRVPMEPCYAQGALQVWACCCAPTAACCQPYYRCSAVPRMQLHSCLLLHAIEPVRVCCTGPALLCASAAQELQLRNHFLKHVLQIMATD